MLLRNPRPEPANAEDGYLLLTVLVMIFLMLLALSIAAPRVAKQIQRDKEQEAVERGLQYKRAIQLYYKKFGAYPTDIKQLENTNQIRFLRKRYKDPITGQDDWRLIHMGEAKVPPMGFFGQPLQAGMSSASTGPGLGAGSTGTPGIYANPDSSGTNGSANGTSGGTNGGSSSFGFSNNNSNSPSSPGGAGSSSFGFNNSTSPNSGGMGASPTGTNGPGASSNSSGSTFGGGPIVGIGIPVKKDSLIQYHKQKKYSDWEFVYDPQEELLMNGGGIVNGGNVNGGGANGNAAGINSNGSSGSSGSSSGFGFNNGGSSGSGFGNSGSGGSSGSGFGNFGSGPSSGPGGSGPGGSSPPTNPPQ